MQFPFSLYPLALGYPFGDFGDHQRAKRYFDSLPEEEQLALLRSDITAGDFDHEIEELKCGSNPVLNRIPANPEHTAN